MDDDDADAYKSHLFRSASAHHLYFTTAMFRLQQSTKTSPSICSPIQVSYLFSYMKYLDEDQIIEITFNTNASLDFKYSLLLVNN